MNRRNFLGFACATIITAGGVGYLLSDKSNYERADAKVLPSKASLLKYTEREILTLASLGPSGHNTQP